jgi:general secretion pathway protein H
MTLLEVLIVLTLIGLVSAGAVRGLKSVTRSELRGTATKVAGAIRFLFDRASTTGKVHRLVIDLETQKYWAEVSDDRVFMPREKETADSQARQAEQQAREEEEARKRAEAEADGESNPYDASRYRPTPFVPKRAKFEGFKETALKPVTLKNAKLSSYYTPRLLEPRTQGQVYLYFFPLGQTEPAILHVSDKDGQNFYSLLVHPLTGRVKIHPGYIEPRVDVQYDDEGNRLEDR